MRPAVLKLVDLGPLPDDEDDDSYPDEFFESFEAALDEISRPLTESEASALVTLFPPEGTCYGFAWTLLHLIESTPDWPKTEIVDRCSSEEWRERLTKRIENAACLAKKGELD